MERIGLAFCNVSNTPPRLRTHGPATRFPCLGHLFVVFLLFAETVFEERSVGLSRLLCKHVHRRPGMANLLTIGMS